MKKTLLFLLFVLTLGQTFAQRNKAWYQVDASDIASISRERIDNVCEGELYFTVNLQVIQNAVANATDKFSKLPGVPVQFPNIKGDLETFLVWENSNFEPELQAKYPQIRSYVGKGVTDKYATINFRFSV